MTNGICPDWFDVYIQSLDGSVETFFIKGVVEYQGIL